MPSISTSSNAGPQKVVAVHRGARDAYQLSAGLHEAGRLETLVTDLYWPGDRRASEAASRLAPAQLRELMRNRYSASLPSCAVTSQWAGGLLTLAAEKSHVFAWEKTAIRDCDRNLGRAAAKLATERQSALLSYSYYGHSAFTQYQGEQPRILFQLHPHPAVMRRLLTEERRRHPDCAGSLDQEWELSLAEDEYRKLVSECYLADYCITASSFTRDTLIEAGLDARRILVEPYGIEVSGYATPRWDIKPSLPLKLLFVGRLVQRKGIKYLLEAMKDLPASSVELTLCGHNIVGTEFLESYGVPCRVTPSASADELRRAYAEADVFILPSVAEGFGQVLLEAMANGLPVITTTNTAGPDLIRDGVEGFLVEPRSVAGFSEAVEYFLRHPVQVRNFGQAAYRRASQMTWKRFRRSVAERVGSIVDGCYDPGKAVVEDSWRAACSRP